jgi:acetolactate decarboxylase
VATLKCNIPLSLLGDLTQAAAGEESVSHIVTAALSQYLKKPIHTLFQVSTSGALVAGIYSGAVSSGLILHHGDFGVGTFENLDEEMVVLDGRIYRIQGNGTVSVAPTDSTAPFAVVTNLLHRSILKSRLRIH